jgi:hypothetical protein
MAILGCRLGRHPQTFIATTPAPLPMLCELRDRESTVGGLRGAVALGGLQVWAGLYT